MFTAVHALLLQQKNMHEMNVTYAAISVKERWNV